MQAVSVQIRTLDEDGRMSDKPLTEVRFSTFSLHPRLLDGLETAGFIQCTPIQALTLPAVLRGQDVAGQAQTGTGKTLAFLVAVVNRLLSQPALPKRQPDEPRALILGPTRELAIQIHKDAMKFCSQFGLRFALIYGGMDYDRQRELLKAGVDVIIATPGRLIDYVKQHQVVSLQACEICVLDEADRMFDLGFIKDIRFLLRRMPRQGTRQTLLFSATLGHRVMELAYEYMNEPEKLVAQTKTVTASRVRQAMYFPADEEKIPLLLGLLARNADGRTMIFVNTKAYVERVTQVLMDAGYSVGMLSGDVPQKKRESLLTRFQKSQLHILVATDVAARGLHIDQVDYVYNFDLPFDAEDYVHRIGRTARLGANGDAISFACERYAVNLPQIEDYIQQKIPVQSVTSDILLSVPPASHQSGKHRLRTSPRPNQPRQQSTSPHHHSTSAPRGARASHAQRGSRSRRTRDEQQALTVQRVPSRTQAHPTPGRSRTAEDHSRPSHQTGSRINRHRRRQSPVSESNDRRHGQKPMITRDAPPEQLPHPTVGSISTTFLQRIGHRLRAFFLRQ